MPLSDIVDVTITTLTTAPTRVGFGTPLVMAYHSNWPERAREYTDVADMITDGFAATDPAVLAVTALLAQNPKPNKVVVGREEYTQKQKIRVTPDAAVRASYDYIVYLNGKEAKFTTDATPTVAEICTGLKAAIDALSQSVTVTDNTTDIDIESNTVADQFTFYVEKTEILAQKDNTPDGSPNGIVADITAVRLENDDWYSLHLTSCGEDVIKAAAAYIETLVKIFLPASPDTEIITSSTTDVASDLQTAGYARTALIYHPKANVQYPGCAWGGKCLPKDPGSITWMFKTLAGVDYVGLTTTQITYLKNKDCNMYIRLAGVNITQTGITAAGEFIDITRGIDFIRVRLQEYIYARLVNLDKVPFTDKGIGVVEAEVRAVLNLAIDNGILAADPEPTISVPLAADVSTLDKADRILPDVKFEATLAGAIHKVEISGMISV